MNPLQGLHHIQHAYITREFIFLGYSREVKETQDIQAMVDTYHYHILLCQLHTRIPSRRTRIETAAMQPQHHRLAGVQVSAPHVEHARVLLRHLIL